jgi:uncharacterized protein (DUF924 family)
MAGACRQWTAELLHFWFYDLRPRQWFGRNALVDQALHQRFSRELALLKNRPARDFLRDRQTAQAAILLFDQLPRNLFRDSPRAFACDPLARAITKGAIARGWDRSLNKHERQFLYMPMMHSEDIADQRLAQHLFAALGDAGITRFARSHFRMVARFGRFPHRNRVLNRTSTGVELRAIAQGNVW